MKTRTSLKTILLDMDGVLWRGAEPVIDIGALFDRIQGLSLQAVCVTNNSARTVDHYLKRIAGYDVHLKRSQIITSAEATAVFLVEKFPQGGTIFVIGETGIKEAIKEKGFRILKEQGFDVVPDAVVVGLDRFVTYPDLALAVRFIQRGAYFVGSNPDLTYPAPLGLEPGAGTIIKAVEYSSGVTPYIIGKPYSTLFSIALERAGSLPEETLMVGDRLATDVLGAQQMGLRTALVLTGISTREQAETWYPSPDMIEEDALKVIERIEMENG